MFKNKVAKISYPCKAKNNKEVVQFLFFLFCYTMCYVSKQSGRNLIFFVFLDFAMVYAMFQNIDGQNFISFVFLYFAMLYYVSKQSSQNFIFFCFSYTVAVCDCVFLLYDFFLLLLLLSKLQSLISPT